MIVENRKIWYYGVFCLIYNHYMPIKELLADEENIPIVYDFIKEN